MGIFQWDGKASGDRKGMHRGTVGKGTREGFEKSRDTIAELGKCLGKRVGNVGWHKSAGRSVEQILGKGRGNEGDGSPPKEI